MNLGIPLEHEEGVLESQDFGIDRGEDQVHIMKFLRDNIYSNKVLAVIREYTCNAFDAHIEGRRRNKAIQIHLPNIIEPSFKVVDFGPGLSPEAMLHTFTKYGRSTKRSTNKQIGCFGLGCKSAFCITPIFEVISKHGGMKRSYSAYIEDSGIGKITLLSEEECTGTGLEIVVPVDQSNFGTFESTVKEFFAGTTLPVDFYGAHIKLPPVIAKGEGWVIAGGQKSSDALYGKVGPVAYPITPVIEAIKKSESDEEWINEKARNWIRNNVKERSNYRLTEQIYVDLPIGSVDIQVSREFLELTPRTMKAVSQALQLAYNRIKKEIQGQLEEEKNWYRRARYIKSSKLLKTVEGVFNEINASAGIDTKKRNELVRVISNSERKVRKYTADCTFEGVVIRDAPRTNLDNLLLISKPEDLSYARERLRILSVNQDVWGDRTESNRYTRTTRELAVCPVDQVPVLAAELGVEVSDFYDLAQVEYKRMVTVPSAVPKVRVSRTQAHVTMHSTPAFESGRCPYGMDTEELSLDPDYLKESGLWLGHVGDRANAVALLSGQEQMVGILKYQRTLRKLSEKTGFEIRPPNLRKSDGVPLSRVKKYLMAKELNSILGDLHEVAPRTNGTWLGVALRRLMDRCLPFSLKEYENLIDHQVWLNEDMGGDKELKRIWKEVESEIVEALKPYETELYLIMMGHTMPHSLLKLIGSHRYREAYMADQVRALIRRVPPLDREAVHKLDCEAKPAEQLELELDFTEHVEDPPVPQVVDTVEDEEDDYDEELEEMG